MGSVTPSSVPNTSSPLPLHPLEATNSIHFVFTFPMFIFAKISNVHLHLYMYIFLFPFLSYIKGSMLLKKNLVIYPGNHSISIQRYCPLYVYICIILHGPYTIVWL